MKIPFINRFTGAVLCEIEIGDDVRAGLRVQVALEKAVRSGAHLRSANLAGADLRNAHLRSASLRSANLAGANLRNAHLRSANLAGADLGNAHLRSANLAGADLRNAHLRNADLSGADLGGADLSGADLAGANLRNAHLRNADLSGADLGGAILPSFAHCPEEGAFIAWKKLRGGCVAKLEIPTKAKRTSSLVGRKMRAEYVKTLAIWNAVGAPIKSAAGERVSKTLYRVGKITRPDKYDDDPRVECTHGIHFFITRKEAEDY